MVSVQEDMRQAGVADYMLIRFKEREKEKLSEKLAGLVRASDVIGADENGALYLLLIQTNKKNYRYIRERLESQKLEFELVDRIA